MKAVSQFYPSHVAMLIIIICCSQYLRLSSELLNSIAKLWIIYPESISVFMFGSVMSRFWKQESYDCRNNKYRSMPSCVIGTLNFLARKNLSRKFESEKVLKLKITFFCVFSHN